MTRYQEVITMETKSWWQSRTIWTGLLTSLWVILAACGLLPAPVTPVIDAIVTVGLTAVTIYFRYKATKAITPVIVPVAQQ
jgi:hypothetical protein